MDFFARQDETRQASRWLVLLFAAAVVAIVAATTLLVFVALGRPAQPGVALFSAANVHANTSLLITTAVAAALAMLLASVFRSVSLRGGGGKVAREVGGQRLDANTQDPQLRQLQNVVEEIALAAGVPVPEIYVLEEEDAINAFAAGYSPADAAIAVTRGTLDKLDRAELQGVIAHEFSHILNGDMRLNIRLIGLVFGILVLAIVGQRVLFGAAFVGGGRRRDNSGMALMLIGIGLVAIGYIGLFFARWIKAAVARQRESLADASAIQFTRHPEGLAGALKKIAVDEQGSQLEAESEEVSHMLFGEGTARALFATHPPLMERIRAIEPHFDEQELDQIRTGHYTAAAQQPAPGQSEATDGGQANANPPAFDVQGLIDRIGRVDAQTLATAAALSDSLPEPLLQAARGIDSAPALVFLLLLDEDDTVRARQMQSIGDALGGDAVTRVQTLLRDNGKPPRLQQLQLLDASLPAVKRRSEKQLEAISRLFTQLSEADNSISVFEFLLARILHQYLRDAANPPTRDGKAELSQRQAQVATTLGVLAHFGSTDDRDAAQAAFEAGAAVTQTSMSPTWPDRPGWSNHLENALTRLDALVPQAKKTLVEAWTTTALHDRTATVEEIELLRAFCVSIHVPMPALR